MENFDIKTLKGYTIMPNFHQRDKSISLKAKGLLSQMFSLPDDWDYTLKGLASINLEGIDAIRSAVKELEKAGYIVRTRIRDAQGRVRGCKYTVYPKPQLQETDGTTESTSDDSQPDAERPSNSVSLVSKPSKSMSAVSQPDAGKSSKSMSVVSQPDAGKSSKSMSPVSKSSKAKPCESAPDVAESSQSASSIPKLDTPKSGEPISEKPTLDIPTQADTTQLNKEINKDRLIDVIRKQASDARSSRQCVAGTAQPVMHRSSVTDQYRKIIMQNISYEILLQKLPNDQKRVEDLVELLVDTVSSTSESIRIAGSNYPTETVRSRLLELNDQHIEYVISCLNESTTQVRNIKQYLLTTLYNAPITMDSYYAAMVQHDLYGRKL